ncbi:hypothetical protein QP979_06535 [Corynebacterium striatum]|uniref:hypothetical protein n=1 Tax=Corynebacterium striatum TaxID=43770 RepID=UPI00255112D4|nr:hypothetical protein [Corynebacterium striatum]MDK8788789.1 hypothetical protein [Corynebacterium striatum]
MTNLTTSNLKRLLAEATPGPWEALDRYSDGAPLRDTTREMRAAGEYLGLMHDPHAALAAAAPELADEILRMREALHDLSAVWEAISIDPTRTPAEQQLAAAVVDHIDQILGDHDDQL